MDNFAKYMNAPIEERDILFTFDFEKGTVNSHIINWCKEHNVSYINGHLGGVYVNIDRDGVYYRLDANNIGGNTFEVVVNRSFTEPVYNNYQMIA